MSTIVENKDSLRHISRITFDRIQSILTMTRIKVNAVCILTLCIIAYGMLSCSNSKSQKSKEPCPWNGEDWIEVNDTVSKKSDLEFGANVSTSLNLLEEILKSGDTSKLLDFRNQWSRLTNKTTTKRSVISQEHYDYFKMMKNQLCPIWDVIHEKGFDKKDSMERKRWSDLLFESTRFYQEKYPPSKSSTTINLNINELPLELNHEEYVSVSDSTVWVYPKVGKWDNGLAFVKSHDSSCIKSFRAKYTNGNLMNQFIRYPHTSNSGDITVYTTGESISRYNPGIIKLNCIPDTLFYCEYTPGFLPVVHWIYMKTYFKASN